MTASPDSANYDKNLFAYCDNNPVVRADDGGTFWHIIVGAAIGIATQYVSDVALNLMSGKSFTDSLKPISSLTDYAAAALSGGLAATGIGLGASIAANAAIGGTTYIANCITTGESVNTVDFCISTGIGAASGAIGGKGANGAKLRGVVKTSRATLKTAVSPKKTVMYSQKVASAQRTAVASGVRASLASAFTNGFNFLRRLVRYGR